MLKTFIEAKPQKSNGQTNIDKYTKAAENKILYYIQIRTKMCCAIKQLKNKILNMDIRHTYVFGYEYRDAMLIAPKSIFLRNINSKFIVNILNSNIQTYRRSVSKNREAAFFKTLHFVQW